jgi:hypothetical protein
MNTYETPLVELLKTVPKDARFVEEEEEFSSTYHPVGRLCHEAADRIAELEAKLSCKTVAEVIAKHEAIPSRKEAIDNAREWLKNRPIELVVNELQTKPLSDEEIDKIIYSVDWAYNPVLLARAIEERHGIK